ncbi:Protein STRUBBELIG-RECEPTOR FAMILY 1 [Morus notabilis]|uniref:Protein STRUBBELIG-RECEPTOR FAMILY 1 n=1 Tax=Morus notabilis TaxID=981085 RepID=W9T2V6_9ROSA|nr:Protein STRUBBELIG-RECEPTOR FAMILY 1 [Morus notabilis]
MGYLKWDKFFTGLVLIFTLPFCSGITDQLDVMAMNNLYVALGYPPLRGWLLVGGDPCGEFWEGVECVFSNITAIKLSGANLGGELGDGLQFLGSVIQIDFSNNHIGGSVPSALPPTLRNLYVLSSNSYRNQLTGSIPDALPVLSQLLELHLQNNRLVGFLDVLRDLPLQDLNIENNLFSGPIPPKLQTIPNFRKDGNPFNTTIIPTPQAAPSASPARAPSSPEEPLWHRVNGPSSSPIIVKSGEPRRFLNAKAIVWIAITGVSIVATLILCLLFSRWFKAKRRDKIAKEHYFDTYKGSTEKPKHDESSFPRSNQTDTEVAKEAVVRPPERSGVDNQRMGFVPKLKQERVMDVRRNTQSSMYMRDNEIDMTDTDDDVLPPPPPPPPFSTDSDIENSVVPTIVSTAGRPMKSRNLNSVRMFTVASLQQYTSSFSQENFLGEGMLGSVFRAELPYGELLAVKKLDNTVARKQTEEEFLELVSNISKLRHANIVELVGYCADHGQRLLVYEYCRNGTLYDALHVDAEIHQKLSWNRRIQVAIGAARALEYLHEVCRPPVIHRNFRSSNLLLDDKLEVHVSDCGLSPLLASTSVSQISAGLSVHGYGAPEFESGSYTYQSDVYSFGVVLLELLTRRKPYDRSRPRGEQFLVRWAVPKLHDIDALSRMVDPSLYGAYSMKSLSRLADIISSCLQVCFPPNQKKKSDSEPV